MSKYEKEAIGDLETDRLFLELGRVLDSKVFRRSPSLSELLNYLAKKSLVAGEEPVTEYGIAQDLLSRDETFDPKTDPIVRVRIKRLREALVKYYDENPTQNQLTVPPGAYNLKMIGSEKTIFKNSRPWIFWGISVASFAAVLWFFMPAAPEVDDGGYPIVEIRPFQNLTGAESNRALAEGMQRQLATDLQRFGTLQVYQLEQDQVSSLVPDYTLSGSILGISDEFDVSFRLERVADQDLIYGTRVKDSLFGDAYFDAMAEISRAITGEIGSRSGPLYVMPNAISFSGDDVLQSKGISTSVFECLLLENEFFYNYLPNKLVEAIQCFEAVIDQFSDDPIALASYWNMRYHSVPEFDLVDQTDVPLEYQSSGEVVLESVEQIIRNHPLSPEAHLLLGSVQLSNGDILAAEISMRQSIALNPGNPVSHAVLSYVFLTEGNVDDARLVGEEAIKLSANPQGWMYLPMFIAAVTQNDDEAAMRFGNAYITTQTDASSEFVGLVLARMSGNTDSQDRYLAALSERDDPLQGYGSFIQSTNVKSALLEFVPEIIDSTDETGGL